MVYNSNWFSAIQGAYLRALWVGLWIITSLNFIKILVIIWVKLVRFPLYVVPLSAFVNYFQSSTQFGIWSDILQRVWSCISGSLHEQTHAGSRWYGSLKYQKIDNTISIIRMTFTNPLIASICFISGEQCNRVFLS